MEKNCKIIEDLLPLYIDAVCSDESKKAVEAHMENCPKCVQLWKDMQSEHVCDTEQSNVVLPESETVLKEVSVSFSKRAMYTAVGILVIVLYWLIYIWQDHLAMVGDYRYFSYQFHELYSAGYLLVPAFTIVWLVRHLRDMYKNRTWKKGLLLFIVLLVLAGGQLRFWERQSQKLSVTCVAEVKKCVDEYHVAIICGEDEVVLSTTPAVTSLLKNDGTQYLILYETYRDNPDKGSLCGVWYRENDYTK